MDPTKRVRRIYSGAGHANRGVRGCAIRRDIHRHPDPSGQEERTAGLVADLLREQGFGVSNPGRGWVGMPHTPTYVADEEAIFTGAETMAAVFLDLLRQ